MSFTIQIQGLKDFEKDVYAGAKGVKDEINKAMLKSVTAVKNDAQIAAPYKTGTLRRSIYNDVQDNGFRGIVGQDRNMAIYGAAQEFGTVGMTIWSKSRTGKVFSYVGNIKPHPYLRPALEKNIDTIHKYFEDAVTNIIATMAGGKGI